MPLIPATIPATGLVSAPPSTPEADSFSLYDIAVGGVQLAFSNTINNPMIRETVQPEKTRVDQAQTAGEQTLTGWWLKSQGSFHGGAGQLQLEPAFPAATDHIRFDMCKNVDVFTPGVVRRLPDTSVLTTDSVTQLAAVTLAGADAVAYLTSGGAVKLLTTLFGTPTVTTFSNAAVAGVKSIATDGTLVFIATTTGIWSLNPATPTAATSLYTYTVTGAGPVLGWAKSRLMLGLNAGVYELDINIASAAALGAAQLRYTHPSKGYNWRCFGSSPNAVLACGDAGGLSSVTQFNLVAAAGAPVLTVAGDVATLPVGEKVLSILDSQGAFVVLGTSAGIRVGTFNTYTGALTFGPLELLPTDPTIPAVALAQRDRFVFAAGLAYDEGGLIRVDLGTRIDEAGRFAWAPDLIGPVVPTDPTIAATAVCNLPVSGRLVMSIPGTGVLLEGSGPGNARTSFLRTSRIRFGTTEPKLFKLGSVRGDLSSGDIVVTGTTPYTTDPVATVGFTDSNPGDFRLPTGLLEWLQLTLTIQGDATLTSYQVKALTGTRKQRHYQYVVAISDEKTTKNGQRQRDALSSRDTLAALEEMDAVGDEVILQEYTPNGVISTRVVIEQLSFKQTGRPTPRSDVGGDLTILLRTVES